MNGTLLGSTILEVSVLAELANPFEDCPWGEWSITIEDVDQAIENGRFYEDQMDVILATREDHIDRIAYLVVHRSEWPISIDVGVPELGCESPWIVSDGNHRLAAAIYRGDETIRAYVTGRVDYARELLKADIADTANLKYSVDIMPHAIYVHDALTGGTVARYTPRASEFHMDCEQSDGGKYEMIPKLGLMGFAAEILKRYGIDIKDAATTLEEE